MDDSVVDRSETGIVARALLWWSCTIMIGALTVLGVVFALLDAWGWATFAWVGAGGVLWALTGRE